MKKLIPASILSLLALVATWEGKRNDAYQDIVGVWTVCYGETRGVKQGDKYTDAECRDMLSFGLGEYYAKVEPCLADRVTQNQRIAVTSLAYNVGAAGACGSTAVRKLNAGDVQGGCDALLRFSCVTLPAGKGDETGQCANKKRTGKFVQGLHNRRVAERKICLTADK